MNKIKTTSVRRFRFGAAALCGVSLLALAAAAQAGELRGRVVDANTGALLEGAALVVLLRHDCYDACRVLKMPKDSNGRDGKLTRKWSALRNDLG